jgi:hypothetical protein
MPQRFTAWSCPLCRARRLTAPLHEAFCLDDFAAMEPVSDDHTYSVLAYPQLTREQHRIEHMMRDNRGVCGI